MYPFVWFMLLLSSIIVFYHSTFFHIKLPAWVHKGFYSCLIIFSIFGFIRLSHRLQAEKEWGEIARASSYGCSLEMMPRYEALFPELGRDPYFLYNYAVESYEARKYEQALRLAIRCRYYWADYDLELLLGILFTELYEYEQAEKHFHLASQMCPVRFIPLYRLFCLYKKQGLEQETLNMARSISKKSVKVDSQTIRQIKEIVFNELNK